MAILFRAVTALAAWAGLGLQYGVVLHNNGPGTLPLASLNFLSFFTILSNILVALSLTIPWIWPASAPGRFLARPATRGGVMLYITVTGLVYFFLLRHLALNHGTAPYGQAWLANALLHYATPLLFAFGWLFLAPKGELKWSASLAWLIFPLAYCLYILLFRGPLWGFYPYPFINVARLGPGPVLVNVLGLSALFIALGLLMVAIDRWAGRARREALKPAGRGRALPQAGSAP